MPSRRRFAKGGPRSADLDRGCADAPRPQSYSHLIDGYKRHVLRDLDSGLVPAVGVTPANLPEAQGAE
jgi:hypothetical protein